MKQLIIFILIVGAQTSWAQQDYQRGTDTSGGGHLVQGRLLDTFIAKDYKLLVPKTIGTWPSVERLQKKFQAVKKVVPGFGQKLELSWQQLLKQRLWFFKSSALHCAPDTPVPKDVQVITVACQNQRLLVMQDEVFAKASLEVQEKILFHELIRFMGKSGDELYLTVEFFYSENAKNSEVVQHFLQAIGLGSYATIEDITSRANYLNGLRSKLTAAFKVICAKPDDQVTSVRARAQLRAVAQEIQDGVRQKRLVSEMEEVVWSIKDWAQEDDARFWHAKNCTELIRWSSKFNFR